MAVCTQREARSRKARQREHVHARKGFGRDSGSGQLEESLAEYRVKQSTVRVLDGSRSAKLQNFWVNWQECSGRTGETARGGQDHL